ncbi:MAG TPA: nicotinate-nucleotide adenylyltransferase [Pyrinomonadaceae bacterium]|jgi:nicotinate-nucleotide adenylyltransferase|nr:nicotinate-nucleotide adenylyltransferase [Pyrinomonadaceae bacterium]
MERRRRIALYGGTFDPVHAGHLAVARGLLLLFALDEVLFIPAYIAPHKRGRRVSPALDRHAMLALATQGEESFRVSTVELEAPESPYTVNTLSSFCGRMGGAARLFFVMGADSWEEITTWREWERVLTLTDQLVVTRPGYELSTAHVTPSIRERIVDVRGHTRERVGRALEEEEGRGTRIYLTDAANVDAAATDVRGAVGREAWDELGALVAPPVAEYIRKYGLYQESNGTELSDAGIKGTH